ncbi:MAG: TIGR00730 family Rossman fold protein [Myxococcales bacterium]|nr:TIGR00730 family Rossman fold protein [Myxococcales bacterium]
MRRVAVFCGSQPGKKPIYCEVAHALGAAIAGRGWGLVYGGAKTGLMGAVADGALAMGGEVYGVVPERLRTREISHQGLSEVFVVESMHARKSMMAQLADAFCVLPGGWGTMDEFCEIVTWAQLSYHCKPIGLLDIRGYWSLLMNHLSCMVEEGFVRPEHRSLFRMTTSVEELLKHVEGARVS